MIGVPRFDAIGKPKPTKEYYRGVAGTVFLAAIRQGATNPSDQVNIFLEQMLELLDNDKCHRIDQNLNWKEEFTRANVAPDQFLDQIHKGWDNYELLCEQWPQIASIVKERISRSVITS